MPATGSIGPGGAPWRRRDPARRREQRLEILAGLLGFFTLIALVNAVTLEVRGQNALPAAGVLLLFAALLGFVLHKRWGVFAGLVRRR